MKRLNKLQINSEKLIKNDELITLRGGDYGGGPCTCLCYNYSISPPIWLGYLVSSTGNCGSDCRYAFGGFPVSGTCQN
ncbi:MAG: hypothetical protein RBS29_06905 [Bacteroidales bacterium]|jgi:natural product precursor|nr:hypothetical protein [Bacteroidales bacterium]